MKTIVKRDVWTFPDSRILRVDMITLCTRESTARRQDLWVVFSGKGQLEGRLTIPLHTFEPIS